MGISKIEIERHQSMVEAVENFGTLEEVNRRFGPSSFGAHEAGDRLWIAAENIELHILNHPTVAMNKSAYAKVFAAQRLLSEAYQIIATQGEI